MKLTHRRLSFVAGLVASALLASRAFADLRADGLLLLVNANVPQSAQLAKHYIDVRHVPADHVLKLDVPSGEEIDPATYDAKIAAPVREYLASPAGKGIRCLVTFYGLPIRVVGRPVTEAQPVEVTALRRLLAELDHRAAAVTKKIDDSARAAGIEPPSGPLETITQARQHIAGLEKQIGASLSSQGDIHKREATLKAAKDAQLASIASANEAMGVIYPSATSQPALTPQQTQELLNKPRDADARLKVLFAVAQQGGIFPLAQIADQQLLWLNGEETDAAVDNELALVRLPDFFRYRWQPNPFYFRATVDTSKAVMVSRIDAPTVPLATKMIDDSIAVEVTGLDGKAVFDSRGLPAMKNGQPDGYGWYDQAIRDAAAFVKTKTKLETYTDDREAVISPREVTGVALYCGWYSLRHYVPSCGFVRGAVGYHVASFEMISLHTPGEKGWVANLIKDGVVATFGPVSEPYLSSFNRPDEFFPLLMTGKLTLAEVYWATCPMTSWKNALIGDPLYRPFAKRPAVLAQDLPAPMPQWLAKVEAAPAVGR